MNIIVNYVPQTLIGLAAIIPLVAALIKYVGKAVDGKNWNIVVKMVLDLMVQAEQDYSSGSEKKMFAETLSGYFHWKCLKRFSYLGSPVPITTN